MNPGHNALVTISKFWREWRDPRLVIAVLNNNDLNQVTWELWAMGDSSKVPETQDADRPTVIDALTDPDVPILPPHITLSQARSYAKALADGDPDASGILWQTFKRATA